MLYYADLRGWPNAAYLLALYIVDEQHDHQFETEYPYDAKQETTIYTLIIEELTIHETLYLKFLPHTSLVLPFIVPHLQSVCSFSGT